MKVLALVRMGMNSLLLAVKRYVEMGKTWEHTNVMMEIKKAVMDALIIARWKMDLNVWEPIRISETGLKKM
jgi:hypothetical protein